MTVIVRNCSPEELQQTIQEEKDAGRRILALGTAKLTRKSTVSKEYQTTEYVVVSQ